MPSTASLGTRGQTGLGHTDNVTPRPDALVGLSRVAISVQCSARRTAVLLSDGVLLTCGAYDQGVLGHGSGAGGFEPRRSADVSEPHLVAVWTRPRLPAHEPRPSHPPQVLELHLVAVFSAKLPVASVSAGGVHNLAITRSNGVYSWGAGSWGRLGLSDNRDRNAPHRIKAAEHLGKMAQVSAGFEHSLLLTSVGAVFQFGRFGSQYISAPQEQAGVGPRRGARPFNLGRVRASRSW